MNRITASYERSPIKWNLSTLILVASTMVGLLTWFVGDMLDDHSTSATAHPQLVEQLDRIEVRQLAELIEKLDERICGDPNNRDYLSRMRELLAEYKRLNNNEEYPSFLLRCARE